MVLFSTQESGDAIRERVMRRTPGLPTILLATLACLGLLACSPGQDRERLASTADAEALPLLARGFHLGEMTSFAPLVDANRPAIESARAQLLDAGMDIGRVQLSWADLEPFPSIFDEEELLDAIEPIEADGLGIFLTLETIDSEGFVLPGDLTVDPLTLADGMEFDDPRIIDRFAALLDWVVPILVAHGGFAISVGNEPDNTILDQLPGLATPTASFLAAARRHIHGLEPRLGVAMTLTAQALAPNATYAPPIVTAGDILSINYYCQTADFQLRSNSEILVDLDRMVELAQGRQIVIQELGCASGIAGSSSPLEGSEADQAEFIRTVISSIRDRPEFRAAYWFTLVDWPPALADLLADPICEEGFLESCEAFRDSLQSYGLVRWDDGRPKSGFTVFANEF